MDGFSLGNTLKQINKRLPEENKKGSLL